MSLFCGDKMSFQHHFLLILLTHADPNLEIISKCPKTHVLGRVHLWFKVILFSPFLGKLKYVSFKKQTNNQNPNQNKKQLG